MSPYAEHLRKWIAFDGPAPADVVLRVTVAMKYGHLTRDEGLALLNTPVERLPVNAPGDAC